MWLKSPIKWTISFQKEIFEGKEACHFERGEKSVLDVEISRYTRNDEH